MDFKNWEARKALISIRIDRKNFTRTHYYKDGKLLATVFDNGRIELVEIHTFLDDVTSVDEEFLNSFAKVKEEIFDELGYTNVKIQHQMKQQSFDNEFRKAAMEELGIKLDHPKAHRLWEMAMDNTRGEGLERLYNEVSELSELLS